MTMQRTRILIDTQYVPRKRTAQWPLTMLHISAVILAIQIAAWFVLTITGSPYRLVVLVSGAQAVVVWGIVMAWAIKQVR